VVLGCFLDPMLREGREVVDISVCGLGASSYLLASMLGHKYAVVTNGGKGLATIENKMRS